MDEIDRKNKKGMVKKTPTNCESVRGSERERGRGREGGSG